MVDELDDILQGDDLTLEVLEVSDPIEGMECREQTIDLDDDDERVLLDEMQYLELVVRDELVLPIQYLEYL